MSTLKVDSAERKPWLFPVAAAVTIGLIVGCRPAAEPATAVDPASWQPQWRRALDGEQDSLHLEMPILGDQLRQMADQPGILRELLLDDGGIDDDNVSLLGELKNLEHLRVRQAILSDASLSALLRLRKLRFLNLPQSEFSDDGVARLGRLPDLELLRLGGRRLTDEALQHVAAMPSLRFLHLIDAPISDDGIRHLHGMTSLESFYLDGARLSDEGVRQLLAALPDLHLHLDQRHHDRDPRGDHPH